MWYPAWLCRHQHGYKLTTFTFTKWRYSVQPVDALCNGRLLVIWICHDYTLLAIYQIDEDITITNSEPIGGTSSDSSSYIYYQGSSAVGLHRAHQLPSDTELFIFDIIFIIHLQAATMLLILIQTADMPSYEDCLHRIPDHSWIRVHKASYSL